MENEVKPLKPAEPPLIGVEWDDANGTANEDIDQENLSAYHEAVCMISLGWALRDDETGITLVTEKYKDRPTYRANKFIPRSLIRKVWLISTHSQRKRRMPKQTVSLPLHTVA